MKILRLDVAQYRVLRDFRIDFSPILSRSTVEVQPHYSLDFLVGVNGTGKSTLLRALTEIFRLLAGDTNQARFGFALEYWLEKTQRRVRIERQSPVSADSQGGFKLQTSEHMNGPLGEPGLVDSISGNYLPEVLAYTSGDEAEWERSNETDFFTYGDDRQIRSLDRAQQVIKELPGWPTLASSQTDRSRNQVLFIKKEHLPLVTLCGLLTNESARLTDNIGSLQDVFHEIGVARFCGFSLRIQSNQSAAERNEFTERLGQFADRTLRLGSENLYVFDMVDRPRVTDIVNASGGGLQLLHFLINQYPPGKTYRYPPISIFLERKAGIGIEQKPPLHLLDWFSDGERTFLGRMCLFTLFGESEALILLDEPEVHFNDYWKRRIVHHIDHVFAATSRRSSRASSSSSHLLISTHSSIALTDARSDSIRLLEREGETTHIGRRPLFQTFGADPSDIMVHIFGAPNASGEYSVTEIKRLLDKARIGALDRKQLEMELEHVAPGYWSYRIRRQLIQMQAQ